MDATTPKFIGYCKDLPIKKGDLVTIKKGVMVKSGTTEKPAGRTYKITVHHTLPGHVSKRFAPDDPAAEQSGIFEGYVLTPGSNPTVCWAGSGGGWSEVELNDIPEANQ